MWVDDNSEAAATTTQPFIFAKLDYILISSVWGRDTLAKLGLQSSPLTPLLTWHCICPSYVPCMHVRKKKTWTENSHTTRLAIFISPNVFVQEVNSCSGRFIPIIVNEVKCAKDNVDYCEVYEAPLG